MDEISSGSGRALQRVDKQKGWTKERRKVFLETLAATCNVQRSMRAAGMGSGSGIYQLRRRDPAFAALWQDAMTLGYERLEAALLAHALEGINAIEIEGSVPVTIGEDAPIEGDTVRFPGSGLRASPAPADIQLALQLLNRHRKTVSSGRAARGFVKQISPGEVTASLCHRLDVLARQLGNTQ